MGEDISIDVIRRLHIAEELDFYLRADPNLFTMSLMILMLMGKVASGPMSRLD